MASRSPTLESLDKDGRAALEKRLLDRQSGKCFICDETINKTGSENNLFSQQENKRQAALVVLKNSILANSVTERIHDTSRSNPQNHWSR